MPKSKTTMGRIDKDNNHDDLFSDSSWLSCLGEFKTFPAPIMTDEAEARRGTKTVQRITMKQSTGERTNAYLKTSSANDLSPRLAAERRYIEACSTSCDQISLLTRPTLLCPKEDLLNAIGFGSLIASYLLRQGRLHVAVVNGKINTLEPEVMRSDDHSIRVFFRRLLSARSRQESCDQSDCLTEFITRLFEIQTISTLLGHDDQIFSDDHEDDNAFITVSNDAIISIEPIDIEPTISSKLASSPQLIDEKLTRYNCDSTFDYVKTMTLRNLRTLFDRIQLTSSLVDPHGSSLEPQEVEEKKVLLRLADNHLTKRLWMDQLVHITQKISQLKTSIQDEIRLKRHPLKKQYHVFVSEIYHQLQKAIDYNPNRLAKLTVIRSALAESMSFIPSSPRIFQSTQYLTESTTNRISMAQQLKNQIETYTTSISKTDFTLLQLKVAWIQFMADHPNTIGPGIIDYFKTIDSYMSCCNTTSEEVDQLVDTLAIHHEVSCF